MSALAPELTVYKGASVGATEVDLHVWPPAEREAWRVDPPMKPSEWAEAYRTLPRTQSSIEGPWSNANAPYLRLIMDLITMPGIIQVNVQKPPQVGVSEAIRNLLGWIADRAPDPAGLCLPGQEKGREVIADRIIPLFTHTPRLQPLLPDHKQDIKKGEITLANGWHCYLMWAGSAASTSTHPIRWGFNDEVDKYPRITGRETDAITLTWERGKTFEDRRRQMNTSSPAPGVSRIEMLVEDSSVKLFFHVPCPHCGEFSRMVWAQLKYQKFPEAKTKRKRADLVKNTPGAVWYECPRCNRRIEESAKIEMASRGRWMSEDGTVTDAEAVPRWPDGTRAGVCIDPFYVKWIPWSDLVAQWIVAAGDLQKTMDFHTQGLGQNYHVHIEQTDDSFFAAKSARATLPELVVPRWAAKVLVAIDTQHDHFWAVVRAWGPAMQSARLWHGRLDTFDELDALCFRTLWKFDGDAYPPLLAELVLIDSGGTRLAGEQMSRTAEVYRWAFGRQQVGPTQVRPIKGSDTDVRGQHIARGKGELETGRHKDPLVIPIVHINVQHYHDVLHEFQHCGLRKEDRETGRTELWHLNRRDDPEYNHHLANVTKDIEGVGASAVEVWKPKTAGARIDLDDCEVYQCAAAMMAHVPLLPDQADFDAMREAASENAKRARAAAKTPPRNPWEIRAW